MNVLDQLQPSKHCLVCGKTKPLTEFLIGYTATNKPIYSQICAQCRTKQAEEDERESGGRKNRLTLDNNARRSILDSQIDNQEELQLDKEDYIEKLDEKARDRDKDQKRQEEEKRHKGFLSNFLDREEKRQQAHTDADTTWADRKAETHSTAFGFDADIHDPLRQTPNATHHFLYVTHPDRMDVKFLLEYVISGKYTQLHTPSKNSSLNQATKPSKHAPTNIKGSTASWTNFDTATLQDSLSTPSQTNYQGKPASLTTTPTTTPIAPPLASAATFSQLNPTNTSNFRNNPASFTSTSTQAAQLHNKSQPVGCAFVQNARFSAGTFQPARSEKAAASQPSDSENRLTKAFKATWGRGRG